MEVTDRSTELLYAVMILTRDLLTKNFKFRIPDGQSEELDLRKYTKIPKKDKTEVHSSEDVLQKCLPVVTDDAPQNCKSCSEVPDTSHWVRVEPEISTEENVSVFRLSSPSGSYECSVSGLRWSCAGPITLQYCFSDWNVFAEELADMQYRPAGPLMDIKLLSGELEEIHLPHFLCLGGCEASVHDAVRVLHGRDSGVCVEVCELTRHHARVLHPSFSLRGVVYFIKSLLFTRQVHSEVLVYQDSMSAPTFRAYLLPEDAYLKQLVERDEEKLGGIWKAKPRPVRPLQMYGFYSLRTDCSSEVNPEELMLRYSINTPNFFEVELPETAASFQMKLVSSSDSRGQPVWRAKFQSGSHSGTRGEQSPKLPKKAARKRNTSNGRTRDAEGERNTIPNTEQVSNVRSRLINGISRGILMDMLDRLQAHQPPVLTLVEAEEILQRSPVQQDQVRFLVDMIHKKGELACGIMLNLLKELDPYLYQELYL